LFAAALIIASPLAHADTASYTVQSSNVKFDVTHGGHLSGKAKQLSGGASLRMSSNTFSIAGAEFTVQAASMDMGMGLATKHMNEATEPASYPTISFKVSDSSPAEAQIPAPGSKAELTLHGTWKMHGVSRDVSIPVSVEFSQDLKTAHVTSAFPLSMKDYGIAAPSLLFFKVDDVINVNLDLNFAAAQ
jgi:polyisoprenoid-binding protein YceI